MMARLLALTSLTAGFFLLSVALPWDIVESLIEQDRSLAVSLIVELRLPRSILALVYGAVLAASGAAIQALFANPLASPDLTGASSGAAFGAVVTAYLIGLTAPLAISLGAVMGALAALGALLLLAGPKAETATLLLAGLAISALTGAATTLALALAPSPFAFYDAYDWLMGSVVDRSFAQAAFAAVPGLATIALLAGLSRPLDALALGEEVAQSLGHDIQRLRVIVISLAALGVGACVAVCGAVGFVGLVAPFFARKLVAGHPGRAILPSAFVGGILLLGADLFTRLAPMGRTLPLGVVTAILGAPFFLALVVHMRWRLAR